MYICAVDEWRRAFVEYNIGMVCERSGECAYKCGLVFLWGMNAVRTDELRAVACLELAVQRGCSMARSLLADLYFCGYEKISADTEKAGTTSSSPAAHLSLSLSLSLSLTASLFLALRNRRSYRARGSLFRAFRVRTFFFRFTH